MALISEINVRLCFLRLCFQLLLATYLLFQLYGGFEIEVLVWEYTGTNLDKQRYGQYELSQLIIIICDKIKGIKASTMDNGSIEQQAQTEKNDSSFQKLEVSSDSSFRYFPKNKQILQFSDLDTKASSHLSSGTHETSFEFSQSSFDTQVSCADEFFREEFILQRKISKQELTLRQNCFTTQFNQHISQLLNKFSQHPHSNSFQNFLQNIIKPQIKMFQPQHLRLPGSSQKLLSLKQVMQKLVLEGKFEFFVHTFEFFICPLTFFIILITYWVQPLRSFDSITDPLILINQKNTSKNNHLIEMKAQENIISIVKSYVLTHSQEINGNQVLFLVCLYFLDVLKAVNEQENDSINLIQKDLVRDIKMFRKIRKIQTNLSNLPTFQSKLLLFQQKHSFISSSDVTFHMLISHILQSFGSISMEKLYKFDKKDNKYRNQYQTKKDAFCLWVLNNLLRNEKKSTDVLYNSAMYIIKTMAMLKKFKCQNNVEGMSYLVPIVANIKSLLPNAWKHVIKRRPEIEIKFNEYTNFMLQHRYKINQLGQSSIMWTQTLFITCQKLTKHLHKQGIDMNQQSQIYEQFISHYLHSRQKCKQKLCQTRYQQNLQNQIAAGFNFGLIQNYLLKSPMVAQAQHAWKELFQKAGRINQNISQSFVSEFFDYWFVGSRQKYMQVDL